jgi:glycosyltransferase involved in cell wall biosynthesis
MWMGRRFSVAIGAVRLAQAMIDVPNFVRLLKSETYDVVLVNSSVIPAPLLAAKLTGTPALLLVRESLMTNPMLRSAIPKRLIRNLLARWSSGVVCISKYVANQFGYGSHIIYPQVDPHILNAKGEPPEHNNLLSAVMLGSVSPEKGQLDAVKAVKLVRNAGIPIHLHIYGHGRPEDMAALRSTIEELKIAEFVTISDPVPNPLDVYLRADLSIVCSKNEAFGKVTAESVLVGRPVVGYDCGGTSEILAAGGGILVSPSPEALSRGIQNLYNTKGLLARLHAEATRSDVRSELEGTATRVVRYAEQVAQKR